MRICNTKRPGDKDERGAVKTKTIKLNDTAR